MSRTQSAQRGRMNKVIATMSAVLLCLAGAANAGEAKAHSRSSSLASTTNTGLFAAAEMGIFDLMTSASIGTASASSNDVKFGLGAGVGYQWNQWNFRVN